MLFWHFIKSNGKSAEKHCFFSVLRAPRQGFFSPPDDKNNDKIKKNFKKWEAPAE